MMKTIYGVIGDPVAHSLSPIIHNAAFEALGMDCIYHAFLVKSGHLHEAVNGARYLGFGGLNVTIPHKEAVLRMIEADDMAQDIGAVNTIDLKNMRGYNTDGLGALDSLHDNGIDVANKRVLVLGAGGAARAVIYAMVTNGAAVTIANRTEEKSADLAAYMRSFGTVFGTGLDELRKKVEISDIIINTTSVGMHPNTDTLITRDMLRSDQVVFDLVYRPLETQMLKEARSAGAMVIDGITMLVRQGARSFKIWTGVEPPLDVMERSARNAL